MMAAGAVRARPRTSAGTCAGRNGVIAGLCGLCGHFARPRMGVPLRQCEHPRAHMRARGAHAAQAAQAAQALRIRHLRASVPAQVPAQPAATPHRADRARAQDFLTLNPEKKIEGGRLHG